MIALISTLGWAVVTIAATYTWVRMVSRKRRNPDYVESLKAAGQYPRYKLGVFFSFMIMLIALIFTALSFSSL